MLFSTVLVLGLANLSLSKPLSRRWDDLVEKHAWVQPPRGWVYSSAAPPDHYFDVRIGLKQDKFDTLIATLMETSDPNHEKYGAHLTKEETDALVAPHPDSVEAVEAWLQHHGINIEDAVNRSGGVGWVTVRVSVAQAERMLGTKYGVYHHAGSSESVVRTMSYSLPKELHHHVDVVAPTTYFGTLHTKLIFNATVPASCATTITPACLRALYNTAAYVPQATNINQLGVAGYLNEFASHADLQLFFQRFRTDAIGSSFITTQVNGGGDDESDPGVEADLDIQYTTGISFPTPNVYYSTGGSPPFNPDSQTPTDSNEPYLDWLNFILAQPSIPQTITTSYGDDEQTVPPDYATQVCNLFAQLGARGTTVFFSSGDFGVGGGDCLTNDGTDQRIFQPAFPASCPYVTAVGGTTRINPEVAVDFSGGGFSRLFTQPSYQSTAVDVFVTGLGTQFSGLYNKAGRAYPDVSAQGNRFQVIIDGRVNSVGGTSASSPTVAAIFSLLNDFRIANGKPSLGFINPLLYSTASSGFNDITSGSNPGCGTAGFTAGRGWDPVTRLGTPDFVKLQALV